MLEVTGTPRKDIVPRAQRLLTRVGLTPKAGSLVHELSGGEQQRVAIARTLANSPYVLLADEPTGNLDSKSGEEILRLLDRLHEEGKTILVVTHDESIARRAGRIVRFRDGMLASDGA